MCVAAEPERKEACAACRQSFRQKKQTPPCTTCEHGTARAWADLHPGNHTAMEVWMHVQTQWRAGAMGVIGIDMQEVRRTARDLDYRWSYGLMSKIQRLEKEILKSIWKE